MTSTFTFGGFSPRLHGLASSWWRTSYGDMTKAIPAAIVPDVQVEFVFQAGSPAKISVNGALRDTPRAMAYAQRRGLLRLIPTGANTIIGFRLSPTAASAALGMSLSSLWDEPVPLEALIGGGVEELAYALCGASDSRVGTVLESWIASRLVDWDTDDAEEDRLHRAHLWRAGPQSVTTISETWGVSSRTLGRHCARRAGLAPKEFMLAGRILRASALLVDHPAMSITEVAHAVGFCDHAAFSNAFRERIGVAPSALRSEPAVFVHLEPA